MNLDKLSLEQKREAIRAKLIEGVATVTFTKVNGERREMPCTLKPELLPAQPVTESAKKERKHNDTVMSAFCTDKQEWRSFRLDSVIDVV